MGTNYNDEASNSGIIPKVMQTIFAKVDAMKDNVEFLIRVSFIEVSYCLDLFFHIFIVIMLIKCSYCGCKL